MDDFSKSRKRCFQIPEEVIMTDQELKDLVASLAASQEKISDCLLLAFQWMTPVKHSPRGTV